MKDIRPALLRTGMGCFAFTAGISLFNVLFLPYARANYGYSAAVTLGVYAAALCALRGAGRSIGRVEKDRAGKSRKNACANFSGSVVCRSYRHGILDGIHAQRR